MIVAAGVLVVVVAFFFLVWYGQERILFQPPGIRVDSSASGMTEYRTSDGQQLIGYVVGDPSDVGILLCFHGNADLAIWQHEWAQEVASVTGYAVFLAEYRGYMSLRGTPTYASTRIDAQAAYDHIVGSLRYEPSRIAYFGHSLGSGVATELAQRNQPSALLLQAPFTSARAMARIIVSPPVEVVWNSVSRIHFDTLQAVRDISTPVSVAHGKRDRIVPFRMGLQVYEAARTKGELLIVDNAGHNDLPGAGGDTYWKWITASLAHAQHHVSESR